MDGGARMLFIGVTAGLIALVVALVVASALGLAMRHRAGRFRAGPAAMANPVGPVTSADIATSAGPATFAAGVTPAAGPRPEVLTGDDLGGRLGQRATLVQFSTAFCAPCRPTRQLLAQVADMVDGVSHVEVDAAARLDLVRRLHINSTPTVLVLDPRGAIVKRASGLPRKADVIAALGAVTELGITVPGGSDSPVERA
jgi:thiol-disulfide isomerase/thioredoxin